jgi:hypothetical protein
MQCLVHITECRYCAEGERGGDQGQLIFTKQFAGEGPVKEQAPVMHRTPVHTAKVLDIQRFPFMLDAVWHCTLVIAWAGRAPRPPRGTRAAPPATPRTAAGRGTPQSDLRAHQPASLIHPQRRTAGHGAHADEPRARRRADRIHAVRQAQRVRARRNEQQRTRGARRARARVVQRDLEHARRRDLPAVRQRARLDRSCVRTRFE